MEPGQVVRLSYSTDNISTSIVNPQCDYILGQAYSARAERQSQPEILLSCASDRPQTYGSTAVDFHCMG